MVITNEADLEERADYLASMRPGEGPKTDDYWTDYILFPSPKCESISGR